MMLDMRLWRWWLGFVPCTPTIPKTGGGLLLRCRLHAGATKIERPDYLVRTIAAQKGKQSDLVDKTVALVDGWLERNRLAT